MQFIITELENKDGKSDENYTVFVEIFPYYLGWTSFLHGDLIIAIPFPIHFNSNNNIKMN
jgi:hypothetical protein